jgi:hypothetical protein
MYKRSSLPAINSAGTFIELESNIPITKSKGFEYPLCELDISRFPE